MKKATFSWVGSEDSEEGHAVFKLGEVVVLSLDLPTFKHAHAVSLALETAMTASYHEGIRQAQQVMNTAMRNMT